MLKAFELARDEINAGGSGKEIELVVWDDGDKVERGITGAKKLIEVDNVWCLAGFIEAIAMPVSDIAANPRRSLWLRMLPVLILQEGFERL
jgi:ABC-type branched-subunit amino acid transport system substrate-binding protein